VRAGERGFTLVEVLIAATISTLLLTALVQILDGAFEISLATRRQDALLRDAQRAVALVRRDVSQARRIVSAGAGGLTLVDESGHTVLYALASAGSDTLVRRVDGGTPSPIAGGVTGLDFALSTVSRPLVEEQVAGVTVELPIASFLEGDWDDWIAQTSCAYEARGDRKVEDRAWCAEEFWDTPAGLTFTRASFRAAAKDHFPAEVDLVVEIYAANGLGLPGTLVAQGKLSRTIFAAKDVYQWCEVALVPVGSQPIPAGGHYWLVLRPSTTGTKSYAGHIEYERLKSCQIGEWPSNSMSYRSSDNAGVSWTAQTSRHELFYVARGLQALQLLTEVTQTVADTVGVSYRLACEGQGESTCRDGFVALHDL
jgi:prepilin-type N-terminal cleavage/methylation domain-containing protein